jgi:hypothetical protein
MGGGGQAGNYTSAHELHLHQPGCWGTEQTCDEYGFDHIGVSIILGHTLLVREQTYPSFRIGEIATTGRLMACRGSCNAAMLLGTANEKTRKGTRNVSETGQKRLPCGVKVRQERSSRWSEDELVDGCGVCACVWVGG